MQIARAVLAVEESCGKRDGHAERDRRDPKFEVLGSKFRKPRTSDLESSPVSPFPLVSLGYPSGDSRRLSV
jgi:hypothetical protein